MTSSAPIAEAARDFYSSILDEEMSGLERFDPKDFRPCVGTILVVLPPKITRIGSIELPDAFHRDQSAGRVAAVPVEISGFEGDLLDPDVHDRVDPGCPVRTGDWVVFRAGAGSPVKFGGRDDLVLLNYVDGPESDILGFVRGVDLDPEES